MTIGAGALFDRDAEKRFRTITRDRYNSLRARMERKKIPMLFTLEGFRLGILSALGGRPDGAIQCRYCYVVLDLSEAALDHAEPLIRGGSPGLDNLELILSPVMTPRAHSCLRSTKRCSPSWSARFPWRALKF